MAVTDTSKIPWGATGSGDGAEVRRYGKGGEVEVGPEVSEWKRQCRSKARHSAPLLACACTANRTSERRSRAQLHIAPTKGKSVQDRRCPAAVNQCEALSAGMPLME